jgi:hypothetical protein
MTKKVLLDTNILIYLSDVNSPFHISSPDKMFENKQLFLSDRTLLEFYRVFTGYLKHSPAQALEVINFYLSSSKYTILYSSFLQFLPTSYILHHPMQIYLGKYTNLEIFYVFLGGLAWCAVLYFLAKLVFKMGLKRNEAVGL